LIEGMPIQEEKHHRLQIVDNARMPAALRGRTEGEWCGFRYLARVLLLTSREATNQGSARPAIEREHLMHELEWQTYFKKMIVYTKIDRYEKLEFANGSNLASDGNGFLHADGTGKRRIDRLGK
jgi:hypothetical protein